MDIDPMVNRHEIGTPTHNYQNGRAAIRHYDYANQPNLRLAFVSSSSKELELKEKKPLATVFWRAPHSPLVDGCDVICGYQRSIMWRHPPSCHANTGNQRQHKLDGGTSDLQLNSLCQSV